MTGFAAIALTVAAQLSPGHTLVIRDGGRETRVGLAIFAPDRLLQSQVRELLKPDPSDAIRALVPDGHLLRVHTAAASPHARPLTLALFDALDADRDGVVTPQEGWAASRVLPKAFDADGDDCLTPLEIVPDLLTAPGVAGKLVPVELFPLIRRGVDRNTISFNLPGRSTQKGAGRPNLDFWVTGVVARPEVPRSLLRPGREPQKAAYEKVAAKVHTVTVRAGTRSWWELADGDGDGQIGPRELRGFWESVSLDSSGEPIDRAALTDPPRTYCLDIAPGVATRAPVRLTRATPPQLGPAWFRALDRNGDGDLARREFVGDLKRFALYDANGDGLISAREAEVGDRKLNAKDSP